MVKNCLTQLVKHQKMMILATFSWRPIFCGFFCLHFCFFYFLFILLLEGSCLVEFVFVFHFLAVLWPCPLLVVYCVQSRTVAD